MKNVSNFLGLKLARRHALESRMGKRLVYRPGSQIAYIPSHAKSLEDDCVEFGFVTSAKYRNGRCVGYFCRFFRRDSDELQTKANGKFVPRNHVFAHASRAQNIVDRKLAEIKKAEWKNAR